MVWEEKLNDVMFQIGIMCLIPRTWKEATIWELLAMWGCGANMASNNSGIKTWISRGWEYGIFVNAFA